ncbi:MAG: hypothetical protein ACI9GW_002770 [Halieaceae bacterium]|jgi:hypothetical protein
MISIRNFALATFLSSILLTGNCLADPQSKSFSQWRVDEGLVSGTITLLSQELNRLPGSGDYDPGDLLARHLNDHVSISADDKSCSLRNIQSLPAASGYLRVAMSFDCKTNPDTLTMHNRMFFNATSSHIHFARFAIGGAAEIERLFTRRTTQQTILLVTTAAQPQAQSGLADTLTTYVIFGFEHILIGLDHIAFLLTLMLIVHRVRDVLLIVSGFTIGHSITLSLSVLQLIEPDAAMVEVMIGFTIALVAAENIATSDGGGKSIAIAGAVLLAAMAMLGALGGIGPSPLALSGLALFTFCYLRLSENETQAKQLRPWLTTLFGLIHGFGFAAVLLEVGLPTTAAGPALLGFNIGVEIGQITLVLAVSLVLVALHRIGRTLIHAVRDLGSIVLCGVGVFWFVQRAYF